MSDFYHCTEWIIEFKTNYLGLCLQDIWDQGKVKELSLVVQKGDQLVRSIELQGCLVKTVLEYCSKCVITESLWDLYRCPMKITCTQAGSGCFGISRVPYYYPSRFVYEFDTEVENMIINVSKTTGIEFGRVNPGTYTRADRIELLATTLYYMHYTSVETCNKKRKR